MSIAVSLQGQAMPWRSVGAATAATLVGVGLARFAYSPLLPVVIAHGWFSPGAAAYLGAANLLGYLAGALGARRAAARFGAPGVLRLAMLGAAISLLACSVPLPFAWFFVWRLISGITGGFLMILAPSAVLPNVPPSRRGLASGLIFTGVGLGIALSGTLVPLLLQWGLSQAWAGLGVFSLILTGLAWHAWPPMQPPAVMPKGASGRYVAICVSYGLCAVGLVPHMVFLVDIVVRGQGRGLVAGSITWVLFGLGALCGPVVAGRLSDAIGATSAVRVMMLVELGAVLALIFIHIPLLGFVIIVPAGMVAPSITAVMLGRVQDAAGLDPVARQRGWTQATVAWAIGQAAAAYGLSWLYVATGGYAAPLDMAAVALLAALSIEAVLIVRARLPG
jgi:predicted MFS family arabinose efflux permease